MSLLFKGRQNSNDKQKKSILAGSYFFIINIFRQGVHSLGEMWRTPLASMMTIAVLGLSLTLPATLYLVVKNVQQVSSGFEEASEISLFVKESMNEQETQTLVKRLALYPEVESVCLLYTSDAADE